MTNKAKNWSGRLIGGALLAAGVAAVFLIRVKPEAEPEDTAIRPIKSLVVGGPAQGPTLYFPGTVEADVEVDLSFEVAGRLIEFPVKRGLEVKRGELLGRLDPRDYENQVKNAEADLEQAKSSLGRMERALAANAVSQNEFSQARAAVEKAEAQLAICRKALDDTRLEARFDGVVSDTFANRFDTVAAGHPVLKLQDVATLTISVAVPEGYIMLSTDERLAGAKYSVRFDSLPGREFPVRIEEFVVTADPATQTYRTTFTMEKPADAIVLPGMTGTVVIELAPAAAGGAPVVVPSDAVGFASDGQAFVWVLAKREDGAYEACRRDVTPGARAGAQVEVAAGLAAGERIATAGVAILTEGRVVRLLETGTPPAETAP